MSTLQKIHKFDIDSDTAAAMISNRLWKLGYASVKGNSIRIAHARRPLGNGAWGMIAFLQRNGYNLIDFHEYQVSMFGEDGNRFYPHKKRVAA